MFTEQTPMRIARAGDPGAATRRLLIDGVLVEAERTFASTNPATGEIVGYAPDASLAQGEAAIRAARRAFDETSWATDAAFRAHCLDQFHRALLDNLAP